MLYVIGGGFYFLPIFLFIHEAFKKSILIIVIELELLDWHWHSLVMIW